MATCTAQAHKGNDKAAQEGAKKKQSVGLLNLVTGQMPKAWSTGRVCGRLG